MAADRIVISRSFPIASVICRIRNAVCLDRYTNDISNLSGMTRHEATFHILGICEYDLPNTRSGVFSGERGIRTPGTVTRTPHFECGPIDHSGISPFVFERANITIFFDLHSIFRKKVRNRLSRRSKSACKTPLEGCFAR